MYKTKVVICGVDTSKLPVLKEKEKEKLLIEVKKGSKSAREALINGNLRLVLSVIQRFTARGENLDDLFQIGCIGLIKAIDNFDVSHNVRFSTYAVPMIIECRETHKGVSTMTRKQALQKAIEVLAADKENEAVIHKLEEIKADMPLNHWSESSIFDTVEQFIEDNGRPPTATDFKKKGMPPHPVIKLRFNKTLGEWLEEHYPTPKPTAEELKQIYTEAFLRDYDRIKPRSQEEFNQNKSPDTRGWQTVATYHNVKSWRNLVKALGLPLYFDMKRDHKPFDFKVNIHLDL